MPVQVIRHSSSATTIISNQDVTTGTTSSALTVERPFLVIHIATTPDGTTDDLVLRVTGSMDGTTYSSNYMLVHTFANPGASAHNLFLGIDAADMAYCRFVKMTLLRSGSTDTFGSTTLKVYQNFLGDA